MAITDSEFLEKQQKFSKSIDQLDIISEDSIANSVTLPGVLLDDNGTPKKYVQARMSIFSKPAMDAAAECEEALQRLITALSDAATALAEAQRVRSEMESATDSATTAANKASSDAQTAISNANTALSQAQTALADAQTALSNAASSRDTTEGLNNDLQGYLSQVSELITTLQRSIASADDTANHPTYVGADNYVYQWNKRTQTYTKTDVYVRGEGFHISKEFHSIAEMEAYSGAGLKEGDFVLINTGDVEDPDNAKIYTYDGNGDYNFLVDMSGAIGFTGKTPQFSIGTITTLPSGSPASASLVDDGTDIDGNPKYKINLSLPKGDPFTYADFTAEQIAELQRPATEAIALCQEATSAANTATATANSAASDAADAKDKANTAAANANTAASGAGNVNAVLNGTVITVTDRNGNSVTQNIKGDGLNWNTMTEEDKEAVVSSTAQKVEEDMVFASVETCKSIISELT